jgi:hypothetical protein
MISSENNNNNDRNRFTHSRSLQSQATSQQHGGWLAVACCIMAARFFNKQADCY